MGGGLIPVADANPDQYLHAERHFHAVGYANADVYMELPLRER